MSDSVIELKKKLIVRISSMNEAVNELRKTAIFKNKEGENKVVMEKIAKYQKELESIQEKVESSKDNNQIEDVTKEYNQIEESITTDIEINSMKREMIEFFKEIKEKWEITIDIMMIIGKYFEENIDFINAMKA